MGTSYMILAWRSLCLLGLAWQVALYWQFHRGKPMVKISLTDLVKLDMVLHAFVAVGMFIFNTTLPDVGVRVPEIPAEVLVTLMAFCIYAAVLYGVVAVVVQYVQVYSKSVLASDILTDSEGRLLIRLLTSCISIFLLVVSVSSQQRPALYYKLTGEIDITGSQRTTIITMVLCLVLLLTSLTLKLKISRENQQLNPEAGGNSGQGQADFKDTVMRYIFCALLVFFLASTFIVAHLMLGPDSELDTLAEMLLFQACFVLPGVMTWLNKKHRKFVLKKLTRVFGSSLH